MAEGYLRAGTPPLDAVAGHRRRPVVSVDRSVTIERYSNRSPHHWAADHWRLHLAIASIDRPHKASPNRHQPASMILLPYLFATVAHLIVWPAIGIFVNILIAYVFQPRGAAFFMFLSLDWHAIPGRVIGLLVEFR